MNKDQVVYMLLNFIRNNETSVGAESHKIDIQLDRINDDFYKIVFFLDKLAPVVDNATRYDIDPMMQQ